MDAIVTGGAGFIGSHVADALIARRRPVSSIDNMAAGGAIVFRRRPTCARSTSATGGAARRCSTRFAPQAVFHLAAQADVARRRSTTPAFDADVNVRGTLKVLEAAGPRCAVVFTSTGGALYGEATCAPRPRDRIPRRCRPTACRSSPPRRTSAPAGCTDPARVPPLGNVYGPRQDPHGEAGVVAIFFGRLTRAARRDLRRREPTRDYVYVGDVVAANLAALEYAGSQPAFNIGTQTETNVIDLLAACQGVAGTAVSPSTVLRGWANSTEAASTARWPPTELGWRPSVNMSDGLAATLASLHP